jgi:hypothetical protein
VRFLQPDPGIAGHLLWVVKLVLFVYIVIAFFTADYDGTAADWGTSLITGFFGNIIATIKGLVGWLQTQF